MSNDGSASQSSGNSSSSQEYVMDLSVPDSCDSTFIRCGTVVRRANVPFREDRVASTSSTEDDDMAPAEKYRREPQYRHSLAAISERRNKHLASEFGKGGRSAVSLDSSTTDKADAVTESAVYFNNLMESDDKSASHTSSSYLSWIESVNSEYFDSVVPNATVPDVDNKVGEWNNFWLNYSNARLRHLSTEQTFSSDGLFDKTVDDQSEERKSVGSTQRDVTEKNSMEYVMLTVDEAQETLKCSQRISEILQSAMKRSEPDEGSNESYYSQQQISCPMLSVGEEMQASSAVLNRERSISCVDHQTLQKHQKQMLKPSKQSSSTSCIDAILNTGVGDILKKVVLKRRDASASDAAKSTRNSFSEWSIR